MSSRTRSGSSIARGPCAIRSGSSARARRTCAAPPHSPACSVTCRPIARPRSIAGRCSSGSGKRASWPARSTATRPAGIPCASRSRMNARFASGACDRSRVAIRRTSMPWRAAAAEAPRATASTTFRPVSPRSTCSSGAQRISAYRTLSKALSSTRSAAVRSSASASCISAIGRSKASSSSAWSVAWSGPTRTPRMPSNVRGASMPRVRAISSAVSMRSEPSRWRCSSALGIARTRARRVRGSRSLIGAW